MAQYSNYLNVMLISEATLKKYTLLNDNVDGKYILPAIKMSQDIDLETLIGTPIVNALKYLVNKGKLPNSDTLEPVLNFATTLLDDFITPYLAWKALANIQVGLNYKLVNSGVIGNQDQQQVRMEYSKAQLLKEQYDSYSNAYGIKLKTFCGDNKCKIDAVIDLVKKEVGSDTPLLLNSCQRGDKVPLCGIYFRK